MSRTSVDGSRSDIDSYPFLGSKVPPNCLHEKAIHGKATTINLELFTKVAECFGYCPKLLWIIGPSVTVVYDLYMVP